MSPTLGRPAGCPRTGDVRPDPARSRSWWQSGTSGQPQHNTGVDMTFSIRRPTLDPVDTERFKEHAAELAASAKVHASEAATHAAEAAGQAKEWSTPRIEAAIEWLAPRIEHLYKESVKAAAPTTRWRPRSAASTTPW